MFASVSNYKVTTLPRDGLLHSNIELEEDYLRSLYPISSFDIDNSDIRGEVMVKIADIDDHLSYYSLVHEAFMTLQLQHMNGIRKIRDIKYTHTTLYVVFEYMKGISLQRYIESYLMGDVELNDIAAVLTDIFNILRQLYKDYNFTHYDLHVDNVIVGDKIYIIDLEYSYALINNKHHGVILSSSDNVEITDSHYWPYDVYKLICFIKYIVNKSVSMNIKRLQLLQVEYGKDYEEAVIEGNIVRMHEIEEYIVTITKNFNERINKLDNKPRNQAITTYIDSLLSYFINPTSFNTLVSKYYVAPRLDNINSFDEFYDYFNITSSLQQTGI